MPIHIRAHMPGRPHMPRCANVSTEQGLGVAGRGASIASVRTHLHDIGQSLMPPHMSPAAVLLRGLAEGAVRMGMGRGGHRGA
jgi:hypothetical protein